MSDRLEGRVILISGAARGQGEAEARLFAAEGACVVLGDVLDDLGNQVARSLADRALTSIWMCHAKQTGAGPSTPPSTSSASWMGW